MSELKYDAVIIPGGGLDRRTGNPQPWVTARLDAALKLDKVTQFFIVLSRGTPHRAPPLDNAGFPVDESASSARYLIEKGVAPRRILLDTWSLDTIGNAFFTRAMIANPLQLRKLCVVTSAFHMPRTRAIFAWVFSLDGGTFATDFCVAPDVGLAGDELEARRDKERVSLKKLNSVTIPTVTSMQLLAQFLLTDHGAYNAESARQHRSAALDEKTTSSY